MFVILMFDALKPLADSGCEFLFTLIRKYFDTIRRANLQNIKRFLLLVFLKNFLNLSLIKLLMFSFQNLIVSGSLFAAGMLGLDSILQIT